MLVPPNLFRQTRSRTNTELDASTYQISHAKTASNLPRASSLSRVRASSRPDSEQASAIDARAEFVESWPVLDKMEARASSAERQRTMTV